jgi:polysaccharide biosynthesis transport protein
MELLKLFNIMWRRKWVVSLSLIFFLLTSIIATILLPQSYTAETQVLVAGEDSTAAMLNELDLSEMAMSLNSDDIQNKIYLATASPVVEKVIWRLQLRNSGGYLYEPEDVAGGGALSTALGTPAIEVTQVSGTDVLLIEATGPSAQAAQLMADTLAMVYIEQTTQTERAEIQQAKVFISEQLELLNQELDAAFSQIAEVQKEDQVIDLESEVRAAVSRLSELMLEEETTAAKIAEIQARMASTKSFRQRESVTSVSATSMTTNPVVGGLRTRLTELRTKKESLLLDNHTAMSPEVRELEFQISASGDELTHAISEMAGLDPAIAQLAAELSGQKHRMIEISRAIQRTTDAFATYPEKMRHLSQLELDADAAEAVYRALKDQRFQIGVAEAMTMADIQIVAPAILPENAANPQPLLNLALGLLLGLLFGAGSAMLLEYIDDSLRKPEDLKQVWDIPQLGLIPRFRTQGTAALLNLPPTDPLAEAHRTIRNSITYASLDKPVRLLAITSSIPAEGKSTVATNLAISMAREGKRVLLVDADLRLPCQHKQFKDLLALPGLVEVLTGAVSAADAVQGTKVERLSVLTAGTPPADPGQLVESLRMRQILGELSRSHDIVVLDTPPVLAVGDALVTARMVDKVIVVTEMHRVTKRMLSEVRNRFEAAQVVPLGFVLNKVGGDAYPYGAYSRYYQKQGASKRGVA